MNLKVHTDKAAVLGNEMSMALQDTAFKFLHGREVDGTTIVACCIATIALLDLFDRNDEEEDKLGDVSQLVFEELSKWRPMPVEPSRFAAVN